MTGASLWGPLKELWETVEGAVWRKQAESVHLLDLQLKKHKPHFLKLFQNPVRNVTHTKPVLVKVVIVILFCLDTHLLICFPGGQVAHK